MAETKPAARKSLMYLHSVVPVVNTHSELVNQNFKRGKFTFTVPGIFKIISNVLYLSSILIFLIIEKCDLFPSWFPYLLPISLGIHFVVALLLYLMFCFGLIINNPDPWVTLDISINLALSIETIIACAFTIARNCDTGSVLQRIPMILGLCGSSISVVGCAALFLLYRYKEDEDNESVSEQPIDPRKSIFA